MTTTSTCEHPVMSRAGKICGAKAKRRATMATGKVMLICMRHANALAVASGDRRPRTFEDLDLDPQVVQDVALLCVLRADIVAFGLGGKSDPVPYLTALDRAIASHRSWSRVR